MKFDPQKHHRQSIRLKGYDYSRPGAYFITVCVQNRECLFGEIVNGDMQLNPAGRILQETWNALPDHYSHVQLDSWVIMPNHIHGIVILNWEISAVGAGFKPAPTPKPRHGLSEIVRALKTFSSRRINEYRQKTGAKLWQRNYYEHIIRNESEMAKIREYIRDNPVRWEMDSLFPGKEAREI